MGVLFRRLRPRFFTSLSPPSYISRSYPVKSLLIRDPACICSMFCDLSFFLHNRFRVLYLESGSLALVFTCRRCFALLAVFSNIGSDYIFSLLF